MKKQEKHTEEQEFENKTLNDTVPEPTIDTDTLTADQVAEEASETDKVSDSEPCGECQELKDKYVRLSAEFDNFRKRTLKEKLELVNNAGEGVWKAILPVADDFERAIKAMEEREDALPGNPADLEGVRLIFQKLKDTMKSQGVTPIEALGEKMDVDFHEAIANVPVEEPEKKGVVIDVLQTGYMLKDKVLRFAKVVIGE